MFPAKTRLEVIVSLVTLFVGSRAHADYVSSSMPLISNGSGQVVGSVIAAADTGTAANGLLPGQVRLTFTVNPTAYSPTGQNVGFTNIAFASDLSSPTVPAGWSATGITDVSPSNFMRYDVSSPNDSSRLPSVSVLFNGAVGPATLDHILTPVKIFLPNPEFSPPPQPVLLLEGTVESPASGGTLMDGVHVNSTPEPSSLALGAVGLAGVALVQRWRAKARR